MESNRDKFTCGECPKCVWFGDYDLHYCNITKAMVEKTDECTCIQCLIALIELEKAEKKFKKEFDKLREKGKNDA